MTLNSAATAGATAQLVGGHLTDISETYDTPGGRHMHQFISGTFDDAATANKVVDDIMAMDYPLDRITIIMSTQTRNRFWSQPTPDVKQKNAMSGTLKGQMSGDLIGAIVYAGESDRPDVAPVGNAGAATR